MAIKSKKGTAFYRLDTFYKEGYNEELATFLKEKGVPDHELEKLNIDFMQNIGETIEFKTENWSLKLKIKSKEEVTLLFGTEMNSDEFAQFLGDYFQ